MFGTSVYGQPYRPQQDIELGDFAIQKPSTRGVPPEIRAGFIRKVYGILSAQMAFTVCFCAICMLVSPVRYGIIKCFSIPGAQIVIFIPTACVLCALSKYKSEHPLNYKLLAAFTVLTALPLGFVCAAYYTAGLGMLIFQAAVITTVCFSGLTAYTFYSGKDFNWMGAGLTAGLCGMLIWGLLASIFGLGTGLIYASCGALIFCGYIIFDTWRVMKEFGCDDAISASIELYLDIVNLFLYILEILSSLSGGDSN